MKIKRKYSFGFLLIMLSVFSISLKAQRVIYSELNKSENNRTGFEIIGRYQNNFLIYKNHNDNSYISVYDNDMKLTENIDLTFVPKKVIETDFVTYPSHSYMFFQNNVKGVVSIQMVKLDITGHPMTSPIELDTTKVSGNSKDKIYSVLVSENKQNIMLIKVNTRDEKRYLVKTLLYNASMELQNSTTFILPMKDRNDFLTDFVLDNDANLVFGRGTRAGNTDNISRYALITKAPASSILMTTELPLDNVALDAVKLKVDNYNNRYLFTGFYYKSKRGGNIEGVSNAIFDKKTNSWVVRNLMPLDDELREDARGESSFKSAFNDYFLKEIFTLKDGSFMIVAEASYQTSRGGYNPYNRWGGMYGTPMDFYGYGYGRYNPYLYGPYSNSFNSSTRYNADNIIVISFDSTGKMLFSNVLRKTQYEDEGNNTISYTTVNTGNALCFVYNESDRRDLLLSYQSIDGAGKVTRPPTFKNLERNYKFYPRFGKQVSSTIVIIPAVYKNNLVFGKVDFVN
ncbi:hypothetical protein [Polluticaenibacter yanchengensis]|uniref:Uncharacterized protein n=1 Tax=Polluticaenibacter yanchengensis TaxID=3014562 RepID=A0ABT4UIV4_9BACT|nr:hypothetical protein [Chitinophagaceae bacterium LY-5]